LGLAFPAIKKKKKKKKSSGKSGDFLFLDA
jgi:hypothetical protein